MIETVQGTLEAIGEDSVEMTVGGIGLRVQVPASVARRLAPLCVAEAPRHQVRLRTHLHVRPEAWQLFGFLTTEERDLFRVLLGIPGIGPRLALGVLGHRSLEAIRTAITAKDAACFTGIPGIGRRTAARILLELSGKLEAQGALPGDLAAATPAADAVDALAALGITRVEAVDRVRAALAEAGPDASAGHLLQAALRARRSRP